MIRMTLSSFRSPDNHEVPPRDWLKLWSALYPDGDYPGYDELIAKGDGLEPLDFERIGRWKDWAPTDGRWKPNVASVAYKIWMQAAAELPKCPTDDNVAAFLNDWQFRTYRDEYRSGETRDKRFGLSRSTTLLHFLSGGRYPIFDSRVQAAIERLLGIRVKYTIPWYLDSYCPIFSEIAELCEATDQRMVDRALFAYGAYRFPAPPA
jgi:hypothetical protein